MKNRIFNLFFTKDDLWTSIIKIFSSSVLTSLITIGLSPLVSRIYSTSAFGIYAIIFATASILSEIITLKYERAILLPEKSKDSIYVFWISVFLAALISCVLYIPIFIFQDHINRFHQLNDSGLIWSLPIISFVLATNVCVTNLAIKLMLFNAMASNRIYISILLNLMILALGYFKFQELGLIISYTLSSLFSSLLLVFIISKKENLYNYNWIEFRYWFKRYINFPKFYLPSVAVESTSINVPNFFFMNVLGSSFLGNFNMSNRIVNTPLSLIGNSIRTVFNQAVAQAYSENKPHMNIFKSNFYRLVLLSILPVGIIFIFGPAIFSFVFGNEWHEAGIIARYLSPVFFFRFITSPLSSVLTVYEKINYDFYIQIFSLTSLTILFYVLWKMDIKNFELYLIVYNIVYCIKYSFEFILSYYCIKNFEKKILL
jgi:O-antigen/teichoic acid export membrane protein